MSDDTDDIVEVYRAAGLPEAHAIRIALEADGISAWIDNEALQGVVGELPFGWNTAPRILVTRSQEAKARTFLERYLQPSRQPRPVAGRGLACLACGKPIGQATVCASCGWSYISESNEPPDTEPAELDDEAEDDEAEPIAGDGLLPRGDECTLISVSSVRPKRTLCWELAAVLAVGVVPSWIGGIAHIYAPLPPAPYWLDSLQLIVTSGCTILVTMYLMSRSGEPWIRFGITRPAGWDVLLAGVMFLIAESIWRLMPHLFPPNVTDDTASAPFPVAESPADYAWLVVKFLVAALAEELVTRGYLITRLNDLFRSRGKAVLLAAILFSSIHLYQGFAGMVDTFVFGLAYGIAFLVCGRIWPLALGHALSNMRIELVGW